MSYFEKEVIKLKKEINKELKTLINKKLDNTSFEKIIKQFVLSGGKRLRPIILLQAYKGVDGKKNIISEALSVELFHNSTLIHDDLMDEDEQRRGMPTVQKELKDYFLKKHCEKEYAGVLFNKKSSKNAVANTIIAGNILLIIGSECLTESKIEPKKITEAINVYNKAYYLVNKGQVMDVAFENKKKVSEKEYLDMATKKTAELIKASIEIGAILGGANKRQIKKLKDYAENIAIAFQIHDDLMDVDLEMNKGRAVGSDIIQGKKTLPIIKALKKDKKIIQILNKSVKTKKDLSQAITILNKTGAIDYCKKLCKKKTMAGVKSLLEAKLEKSSEEFFLKLAENLLTRKN